MYGPILGNTAVAGISWIGLRLDHVVEGSDLIVGRHVGLRQNVSREGLFT